MRTESVGELIGVSIGASRPFVCEGREHRGHGVVRMSGNRPFWSKRDQDPRPEFSNVPGQFANCLVEINAMQLTIGVVENNGSIHFQDFAGGGEFLAADGCEFQIGFRATAMGSSLSGSKT